MNEGQLRTTRLFVMVGIAALALGGAVLWQVADTALRSAGVNAGAAADVIRLLLITMFALALVLVAVVFVAGRAYARSLAAVRNMALARARGDSTLPAPEFAVAELTELVSAIDRLAAQVSSREATAAREGGEVNVLLDAISEGIIQLDRAGRIVRANPAARVLLGISQSSIGQPITTHIRHAELRRLLERAASGEAIAAAEIGLDDRRVIMSAHALERGGTVVAFVDLTEVRRLEGVRRDFVANVSHELKTPLTSIRGYVETLLTDDELPADVRNQFLQVVQKSADRLHDIIDDLLDLSRLESGGWRPEPLEVNAIDVIEDVWHSCSQRAGRRNITFQAPARPATVIADPGGLRQVLSNLFDNALRYTPDGGRIEVTAVPVTIPAVATGANGAGGVNGSNGTTAIAAAQGADAAGISASAGGIATAIDGSRYIAFEVRDTGSGIPSDSLPRIFERFYRVDPARSRAAGGTGLGLSIVKHLVESMGGDVSAESELGKGTIIRFRLPSAE